MENDTNFKILVPLNGSKHAETILPLVISVAHKFGGTVILLKVDEPDFQMAFDEIIDRGRGYGKHRIPKLEKQLYLARVEATLKRENVKTKIIEECGDVVTTIIDVASREDADLIAMSCRDSTGSQNSINRSVMYRLLLHADRPLINPINYQLS
jgi:nucleotide-binding universal stress UspA family protein